MNYILWSQEYFKEANIIKDKLSSLKLELSTCHQSAAINEINRRMAVLYNMYLDCIHTAKLLKSRGEADI